MDTSVFVEEVEEELKIRYVYLFFKRLFDIIIAIIGCLLLVIFAVIIKVISMLNKDFDSIFYSQYRVGLNGNLFKLYKFRSMVSNADELLANLLEDEGYKKEWEEHQKFDIDPRITKIGKIIRKTSIDEFPQFINILKGDMSLIGPRPLIIGELESHNGNKAIYESVRPGLTGWWASHGRSNLSYQERLELEYHYCLNCSFLMDIKCFFLTVKTVLFNKDAK